jgi:hypothetical protein
MLTVRDIIEMIAARNAKQLIGLQTTLGTVRAVRTQGTTIAHLTLEHNGRTIQRTVVYR